MRIQKVATHRSESQLELPLPPTYTHSSKRSDWVTPTHIIAKARKVMGSIDLDPATKAAVNKRTVKATRIFTPKDDGLSQDWTGNVWLNPPFGKVEWPNEKGEIKEFSSQAVWSSYALRQWGKGKPANMIMLFNAATSQVWFRPLYAHLICFPHSRLSFLHPDTFDAIPGNQYASAIVCVSKSAAVKRKFYKEFSEIGTVLDSGATAYKWQAP